MPDPVLLLETAAQSNPILQGVPTQAVRSSEQALHEFGQHRRSGSVWVAPRAAALRLLASVRPSMGNHRLLLMEEPTLDRWSWLHSIFRVVVAEGHGLRLLAREDLREVLVAPNRDDLFVGGSVNFADDVLVLYRGNLQPVTVPFSWFKPTAEGTAPDFLDFEVVDCGTAIRLGGYEASTRSILYDFDPKYRSRAKKLRVKKDVSFGGALRRLRLMRGLALNAFEPDLTAKEVSRIELGRVKKPRNATIEAIAKKLGVEPHEIATY